MARKKRYYKHVCSGCEVYGKCSLCSVTVCMCASISTFIMPAKRVRRKVMCNRCAEQVGERLAQMSYTGRYRTSGAEGMPSGWKDDGRVFDPDKEARRKREEHLMEQTRDKRKRTMDYDVKRAMR